MTARAVGGEAGTSAPFRGPGMTSASTGHFRIYSGIGSTSASSKTTFRSTTRLQRDEGATTSGFDRRHSHSSHCTSLTFIHPRYTPSSDSPDSQSHTPNHTPNWAPLTNRRQRNQELELPPRPSSCTTTPQMPPAGHKAVSFSDDVFEHQTSLSPDPALDQPKRRAGRPKGSKNKSTLERLGQVASVNPNDSVDTSPATSRRRPGRPKGSKNKALADRADKESDESSPTAQIPPSILPDSSDVPAQPIKRGPGRPKGSGKKKPVSESRSTPALSIAIPSGMSDMDHILLQNQLLDTPATEDGDRDGDEDDESENEDAVMRDVDADAEADSMPPAPPPKRKAGRPRKAAPAAETKSVQAHESLASLPPHELYFYNSKPGASKTSNHTFPTHRLVGHDAAHEWVTSLFPTPRPSQFAIPTHTHREAVQSLHSLQASMFGQWIAEFEAGFNICAYGYGSKIYLARQFAASIRLTIPSSTHPILIVDGFSPDFSLRHVLAAICNFLVPADLKLPTNVVDLRDIIVQGLSSASPWKDRKAAPEMIVLIINSIDATPMRTARTQSILADLASMPSIAIVATADTPNFQLMWDADTRERLHMVFHDCTTFASLHVEADMVQTIEHVLGSKNRRKGGIGGVEFVLKSLPANARRLFGLLITEQLDVLKTLGRSSKRKRSRRDNDDDDDDDDDYFDDDEDEDNPKDDDSGLGVDYHVLYTKMSEELICTSIHQFHTLLKEFVDHQLIDLSRDGTGATKLRVPFRRSELATLLAQMDDE